MCHDEKKMTATGKAVAIFFVVRIPFISVLKVLKFSAITNFATHRARERSSCVSLNKICGIISN